MSVEALNDMENRIIEAAKAVFVRKGYEATKMGDIAAEVGISRTALHYYFRTKEMLFDAIFGQLMGRLLPNVSPVLNDSSTFLEKLPRIIEAYIATVRQIPSFPIFIISEMNRDPEHLFHAVLKHSNQIVPILKLREQMQDEMEKGIIKEMPFADLVSTLVSLVVFPFLAKYPLMNVLLDNKEEAYEAFLDRRSALITDIMVHLLTPDKKQ